MLTICFLHFLEYFHFNFRAFVIGY